MFFSFGFILRRAKVRRNHEKAKTLPEFYVRRKPYINIHKHTALNCGKNYDLYGWNYAARPFRAFQPYNMSKILQHMVAVFFILFVGLNFFDYFCTKICPFLKWAQL